MIILLPVLAMACCLAVVWAAVSGRIPAATGWVLVAATAATTVVSVLAGDIPSRFAASVLACGCMAESAWTMASSSWRRRRTSRALASQ